ncbi:class F sortase [Streptomyces phaeofaciens JCM 4814]|uniref:Class F sortase n=1 Tax=Streptomyces phaeofaciens TaxID=68254 RepID=A0A918H2Z1_9ACTN|nr:class F sortase [Streptomyces phaeofaciens]GGT33295.1 class F sortase [Streptomyces phaeofaciens]
MAPGHSTDSSPPSLVPSVRVLAWTLVAGIVLVTSALHDGKPPQPSEGQAFSPLPGPMAHRSAPAAESAVPPLPPAEPLWLRIPAIHVDAPVTKLRLDASGALRPPPADRPNLAGWYGGGTTPGSVGTAVTAGHVDLRTGIPGVFYDLGAVTKGNSIEIDRADRRTAVFTVDAVEVYDKERFPSEKVYGGSGRAELRVITCGGGYTKRTGYQGNVVVYATLTAVR